MTTTNASSAPGTPAAPAAPQTCCGKPMSTVCVTDRGAALALHSCTGCGRHAWERDGQAVDRSGLLDGVRTFLAEPRPPVRRRRRTLAS